MKPKWLIVVYLLFLQGWWFPLLHRPRGATRNTQVPAGIVGISTAKGTEIIKPGRVVELEGESPR
jgi:hypothetical protein